MALVDPCFSSKSPKHDVTLTLFVASLWKELNFNLHIWCKIDGPKGIASFALITPLVWQISRKDGREAKKDPPVGRGLKLHIYIIFKKKNMVDCYDFQELS